MLAQATLAAVLAYILLTILGVPFAAALAIVIFFADLVPLVGATIGALIVGLVTLFTDFPTATIVWAIYSVVYQQLENTLIQPQIQKRAVNVHPFIVLVSVLFGATLLGVIGALVAIPVAASVQIAIREWWAFRHDQTLQDIVEPAGPKDPPPPIEPAPGAVSSSALSGAAREQAGERCDAAADDEPGDGRADDHLALVRAQLPAPVGGLRDLAAELLDGDAELGAVGLDRAPDLLRRALRAHRASTFEGPAGSTPVPGVAGCGAVMVALISWASSIAICGVGGVPFLKKRAARKPASPPSRNRTPATIR